MKASAQVQVICEALGLGCRPAIEVSEVDWDRWMQNFQGIPAGAQSEAPGVGVCPECGEQLVGRNGKYGAFVGCAGYPTCKYSRSH